MYFVVHSLTCSYLQQPHILLPLATGLHVLGHRQQRSALHRILATKEEDLRAVLVNPSGAVAEPAITLVVKGVGVVLGVHGASQPDLQGAHGNVSAEVHMMVCIRLLIT